MKPRPGTPPIDFARGLRYTQFVETQSRMAGFYFFPRFQHTHNCGGHNCPPSSGANPAGCASRQPQQMMTGSFVFCQPSQIKTDLPGAPTPKQVLTSDSIGGAAMASPILRINPKSGRVSPRQFSPRLSAALDRATQRSEQAIPTSRYIWRMVKAALERFIFGG